MGKQAMLSVAGIEKAKLEALCKEAGELCAAGVFTFEDGLTLVQQRGKYMQEAAEVGKELDAMLPKMKPPNNTVYMNATAQPVPPGTAPKEIVEKLKMQLTSPVLWEPSVKAKEKLEGVGHYV